MPTSMPMSKHTRRSFLAGAASAALGASAAAGAMPARAAEGDRPGGESAGSQRLSLAQLRKWESLQYGMFIHFGMNTFVQKDIPDGKAPLSLYAPDRLDVDQWVSVARDAGMKYIVLTAKHVAGHCLWPSKYTSYTVANSPNKTNVCEQLCKSCEKRGVLPAFYYCSWDNYHRFGSKTPSDGGAWEERDLPKSERKRLRSFTTSLYQDFQTAQITELLTQFGPIAETWIDIPEVLGRGYRTFLYERVAALQPETVVMMNSGIADGSQLQRRLFLAVRPDRHGADASAGLGPQEMAADRREGLLHARRSLRHDRQGLVVLDQRRQVAVGRRTGGGIRSLPRRARTSFSTSRRTCTA